jgi:nucleoid-associated protein YgaU
MLTGCQTMRGWFGGKSTADSMDPVQDPDYYADSSSPRSTSDYQSYEPYEPPAGRNPSPTLSAPVSSEPPSSDGARYHTVGKGDTLYALARRYYSDQRRWKDIYEANRDDISDANKIRVGQRLVIP